MERLSREDWLEEGFQVLSEFAQDKLKILYLCERLGVTRGSFYHHFEGIEDYIEKLMEEWESRNTLGFIETANRGKTPKEQLKILGELSSKIDQKMEAAIRSWSYYNTTVKNYIRRVDESRIKYLNGIFLKLGFAKKRAQAKARLDYATLVGVQQLFLDLKQSEYDRVYQEYLEMLKRT